MEKSAYLILQAAQSQCNRATTARICMNSLAVFAREVVVKQGDEMKQIIEHTPPPAASYEEPSMFAVSSPSPEKEDL
jgi:hypothetical protein